MADTAFVNGVTLSDGSGWAQDMNNAVYRGVGLGGAITTIASATSPDIFAATVAGVISYTGTTTCTSFVAAPYAGMRRTLICAGAAVFTAGANLIIDGTASASNFTAVANQKLQVIAITTTQFTISPLPVSSASTAQLASVRQTVLGGTIDANGFPSFGGATGSGTVTQSNTLTATAANGFNVSGSLDRVGQKVNPSWTGLTTNGTMFLGVTVNADGTLTEFSTTLAPTYQWGGTFSTTANQRTFNIQSMQMQVGNGATASQAYDVFVGQVTVAGAVVTAIVWYAIMGRYKSVQSAAGLPAAATRTSFSHNIGTILIRQPTFFAVCTTADGGWSVGQICKPFSSDITNTAVNEPSYISDRNTVAAIAGATSSGWLTNQQTSLGTAMNLQVANWAYFLTAERAF